MWGEPGEVTDGRRGSLPRLVVPHPRKPPPPSSGAQEGQEAASALRTSAGAALLPSRARLITTLEVSEFVNLIKASIPGSEQQAQSLQMSGRDEFG